MRIQDAQRIRRAISLGRGKAAIPHAWSGPLPQERAYVVFMVGYAAKVANAMYGGMNFEIPSSVAQTISWERKGDR